MNNKFLLSFYGDDFTGSTDVMETLALKGVPTALFLKTPTLDEVNHFILKRNIGGSQLKAFGVAGIARSLDPEAMKKELEPIFAALAEIPVDFFQYKICSTLDSAPEVGNIGVAADLAIKYFPSKRIPFIVGAPFLNRFVVFGNLFARLDGTTYRIDRHPVMSRHPVTPMEEGDIRLHLAKQTSRLFQTIDLLNLDPDKSRGIMSAGVEGPSPFLLFDTLTNENLVKIGEMLIEDHSGTPQFIVGSSGISYGLARYLREKTEDLKNDPVTNLDPVRQILVAAGSCSPVTERQIKYAVDQGMKGIRIEVLKLLENRQHEIERICKLAIKVLKNGKSPILYTALGPADPSITQVEAMLSQNRNTIIGESIGEMVSMILEAIPRLRTVIVGGDTSGYVSRYLKIYALETLAPVAPGAPLCVAHAVDRRFDGLEIALKGGQNGKDDYFQRILG
ncbi:MAG: four-carbon acid sugar kinase family protein [Saprospiraceae bacterium]|nr:four-carbon acid sugar kinase family protein [Saprospiraceae bacterium]